MKAIAPSILSADFSKLGREIEDVEKAGADWIHIDVMDGHFVPNITMGPIVVEAVRSVTRLPLDVHLMIEHPERFIKDFKKAGADLISVHVETCVHLNSVIQMIRKEGARPGVVLNPSTPVTFLDWILEDVDFVLLMSVNPGFGGQGFIQNSIEKIKTVRSMIQQRGLSTLIQVDGGVNEKTIKAVSDAGTDVFVAGSAIFGTPDYKTVIDGFKKIIGT